MYTELFETLYPINTPRKPGGVVVTAVGPLSLGERAGLRPGDRIVSVNGSPVHDFLDFQFYTGSEDRVALEIVKAGGESSGVDVKVGEAERWGLDFEYFAPPQCANDCILCFCNQNPAGSRESLFFKDEDTRLSFLHGNYTTMSSISKLELDRIIEQRLSPQYVSVHATDPEVRRYLLGRKRPDDVMAKMRFLVEHGIGLHAQIVLCPTINDGEILRRTADVLASLHPGLGSVAVVPLVFTNLHNYRHLLTAVRRDFALELIRQVEPWQREFKNRLGTNFIFLADEFYLKAGLPIPAASHYGDYPQIEDGVGMVRRFMNEAGRFLKPADLAARLKFQPDSLFGTVATGELFYPQLAPLIQQLNERLGTRLHTAAFPNQFFGPEVTVAGLVAGSDLLRARDRIRGDFLVVPEQACLKSGHVFLDDLTLESVEESLGIPVAHGGPSLKSLVRIAEALESRARAAA